MHWTPEHPENLSISSNHSTVDSNDVYLIDAQEILHSGSTAISVEQRKDLLHIINL